MADERILKLMEFLKTAELEEEDRSFLLSKLSDESMTIEEKERFLSDFIQNKSVELDNKLNDQTKSILDDTEQEMAQAEREYNASLESLEKEAQKLTQETSSQLE